LFWGIVIADSTCIFDTLNFLFDVFRHCKSPMSKSLVSSRSWFLYRILAFLFQNTIEYDVVHFTIPCLSS
jgi:hypothetical protein